MAWRSRDRSWDYCRIALDFFRDNQIPFWEMTNADALVGNAKHDNNRYCLAKQGVVYLVYLPNGGSVELNLRNASDGFTVKWFDPRNGGVLSSGSVTKIEAGAARSLGLPPNAVDDDWLAVVRPRSTDGNR